MNWLEFANNSTVHLEDLPVLSVTHLRHSIITRCHDHHWRPMSFFGSPLENGVRVFAIMADDRNSMLY